MRRARPSLQRSYLFYSRTNSEGVVYFPFHDPYPHDPFLDSAFKLYVYESGKRPTKPYSFDHKRISPGDFVDKRAYQKLFNQWESLSKVDRRATPAPQLFDSIYPRLIPPFDMTPKLQRRITPASNPKALELVPG